MKIETWTFNPNDPRLVTGTPDQQRRARREWEAARAAHAIISTKEEIPRSQLVFSKYWIEDEQGNFFREFGGDPAYAYTVRFFYFNPDGMPIMLEPADPPNRAELERRQARKEQRRIEREAAAKQRRAEMKAAAGR